ncbi:MAG: YdcF family protein, partial [Bacteroidales bacterium]|nr:YdcF family protein [Bacteroidales bacterium]
MPFWARYHLGTAKAGITGVPDYIVVLGGGGIPGCSGLMRTYYGAEAAAEYPSALVIVAVPGNRYDSNSTLNQMKQELVLRGVVPERILVEDTGVNTRAQALRIVEIIKKEKLKIKNSTSTPTVVIDPRPSSFVPRPSSLLLITSPEHLYRAVLTFRKAGFKHVDGIPTFESELESNMAFSARKLGGRFWVPDVGESISLRYRFWDYLGNELTV